MLVQFKKVSSLCLLSLLFIMLQACASNGPHSDLSPALEQQRLHDLNQAIASLDASIDPAEAERAARIAIGYSQQLAREYEVGSSPLTHNVLVNLGIKSRGLCIHWTDDLLTRLRQEKFNSLNFHWGIANYQRAFRIEHSSAIVSAVGAPLEQGLVLDPWRNSGRLFWSPTAADPSYRWRPQAEIHALKRAQRAANLR